MHANVRRPLFGMRRDHMEIDVLEAFEPRQFVDDGTALTPKISP
jgi:hypothetical protein